MRFLSYHSRSVLEDTSAGICSTAALDLQHSPIRAIDQVQHDSWKRNTQERYEPLPGASSSRPADLPLDSATSAAPSHARHRDTSYKELKPKACGNMGAKRKSGALNY